MWQRTCSHRSQSNKLPRISCGRYLIRTSSCLCNDGGSVMLPSFCDGISRRGFLRLGSIAGLSLAQFLRLQATHAADGAAAKKDVNCIFIFILGGMLHHVFLDYKSHPPPYTHVT